MPNPRQSNQNQSQKNYIKTIVIILLIGLALLLVAILTRSDGPADTDLNLNQQNQPIEQPVPTNFGEELPEEDDIRLELNQDQTQPDPNQPAVNQETSQQETQNNNQTQTETMDKTNVPQPDMVIDQTKEYTAVMETNAGDIQLKLFADQTPITVNNFVYLAQLGFYDNLTFHRIIDGFMIQGGCPLGTGTGSPGYRFQDEDSPTKLVKGSLAMANSGPNTNGSQFFIVTADEVPWLDGKHTNFGEVIGGMEVVEKIEKTATGPNDAPNQPVIIQSVTISEN